MDSQPQLNGYAQTGVESVETSRSRLDLYPGLISLVLAAKRGGPKTEPAFSHALGLLGAPYESILSLEALSDTELAALNVSPTS